MYCKNIINQLISKYKQLELNDENIEILINNIINKESCQIDDINDSLNEIYKMINSLIVRVSLLEKIVNEDELINECMEDEL